MKKIIQEIQSLIWEPIDFVKQKSETETRLGVPFAIVLSTALLQIAVFLLMQYSLTNPINKYLFNISIAEELSRSIDDFAPMTYFITLVGGISILPFWIVGSGVMTCLAVILNGRENFKKILVLYGYAHIPLVAYGLVALAILLLWPPVVGLPSTHVTDLQDVIQNIHQYRDDMMYTVQLQTIRVLGFAAQLWSLTLLGLGASVAQKMSYLKGLVSAWFYGFVLFGASSILSFLSR